jgi:hypothetical protein
MFEMTRQPPVRRIPVACFQHPVQFRLHSPGGAAQAMLGDLAPLISIPQLEARLEQMPHRQGKGGRRRGSDLRHLPAPLEQMAQTTLMEG